MHETILQGPGAALCQHPLANRATRASRRPTHWTVRGEDGLYIEPRTREKPCVCLLVPVRATQSQTRESIRGSRARARRRAGLAPQTAMVSFFCFCEKREARVFDFAVRARAAGGARGPL